MSYAQSINKVADDTTKWKRSEDSAKCNEQLNTD